MRAYLEVIDGRYAGTTIVLQPGDACQVGSQLGVDLFLPDDRSLASIHFIVTCDGRECQIRDAGSGATFVNNEAVTRATLRHSDWIVAGSTLFWFLIEGQTVEETSTPLGQLLQHLQSQSERLLVLVDAAFDPAIVPMLETIPDYVHNLRAGIESLDHVMYQPWLAVVPKSSHLLEWLVRNGWGKGWCVWLTSARPYAELYQHFRNLLERTQYAANGAGLRFFDPRVLRVLLPECDDEQAERLFGPVSSFIVESQLPHTCLTFRLPSGKVTANSQRLSQVKPQIPTEQQLQEVFAASRQDFADTMLTCLRQQLPAETKDRSEAELRARIQQAEAESAARGLQAPTARAQYVFLSVLFGQHLSESHEVAECLRQPRRTPDDNLRALVGTLNQRRG